MYGFLSKPNCFGNTDALVALNDSHPSCSGIDSALNTCGLSKGSCWDLSQAAMTSRRLKPRVDESGTTADPPVLESFRSMQAVRMLEQGSPISTNATL